VSFFTSRYRRHQRSVSAMNFRRTRTASIGLMVLLPLFGNALATTTASGDGVYQTVAFAENDSVGDQVYATQTESAPTGLTLFANLTPSFSNPGMTFLDWNTEANGSGTEYSNGESYDFTEPLILYAIWIGPYETVTFAENDSGTDSTEASQTEDANTSRPNSLTLGIRFRAGIHNRTEAELPSRMARTIRSRPLWCFMRSGRHCPQ
jgi:hypothetical protein